MTIFTQPIGISGDPLVLLHGNVPPDSLLPIAERLSAYFSVLLVHRAGFGKSAAVEKGSAERASHQILEAMTARGIGRFHVAGHSYGGYIAMRLALEAPERLMRLSLLAPVAATAEVDVPAFKQAAAAMRGGIDLTDVLAPRWVAPRYLAAHPEIAEKIRGWQKTEGAALADDLEAAADEPSLYPRLGSIPTRALVRVGELDLAAPPDVARSIAEALPHGQLEVVEGAGHLLAFEDSADTASSLAAFHGRG